MKRTFFKVTLSAMILLSVHVNSNAQPKMEQVQPETGRQMTSKSAGANANLKKEMTSKGLGVNANLPEESKDLMKFSGRWNGDITIIKDGKSRKVNYSMIGRVIAGGKGMYIEEAFSDSVLGDMKGANLVGYSKEDSKVHWYSIDGDGVPHDHVGVWKAPDSLSISHSGMRKGSSYSEKIEFSFKGRDEFSLNFVANSESKEAEKAFGVFKREKPAQPNNAQSTPAPGKK